MHRFLEQWDFFQKQVWQRGAKWRSGGGREQTADWGESILKENSSVVWKDVGLELLHFAEKSLIG